MVPQKRRILVVTPYFPPCTLAGVHRARYLAKYLPRMGWEVVILTVEEAQYTANHEGELTDSIGVGAEIVRTKVLTIPGVRDLGLRSLVHHFFFIARRVLAGRSPDLIFISIPSNFSALIAPVVRIIFGVRYVIDFQDPWFLPGSLNLGHGFRRFFSNLIAFLFEPFVVLMASGVSSVNASYLSRNVTKYVKSRKMPFAALPIGFDPADFTVPANPAANGVQKIWSEFRSFGSVFVYAGTFWEDGERAFEILIQGLSLLSEKDKLSVRIIFIGTDAVGKGSTRIQYLANKYGVANLIYEHPGRVGYLQTLQILRQSYCVIGLGSVAPHYTPSKLFQLSASGRPILLIANRLSPRNAVYQSTGVYTCLFDSEGSTTQAVSEVTEAMSELIGAGRTADIDRQMGSKADWHAEVVCAGFSKFLSDLLP